MLRADMWQEDLTMELKVSKPRDRKAVSRKYKKFTGLSDNTAGHMEAAG